MDVIHKTPRASIYFRTDYIVNSDMTIPYSLAFGWRSGVASELARRVGLPAQDRAPQYTPIVLHMPVIPKGRIYG